MRRGLTITAAAAVLSVCGVTPASASSTWTLEPTPTPALGVDGQLLAVSCLTANDCTAVGGYTSTAGPVPLAERWDGSTWSIQTTPVPTGANFSILDGVSCTSATNCMAVGSYGTAPGNNSIPLAEHWDGSSWSIQTMPVPAGGFGFQLKAVSCSTATSCTAVGQYQTGTVPLSLGEGWNGSTWTVQTMPSPSHVADLVVLEGVSCTAPGTCTAAGWFQRGGTRVFVTLADKSLDGAWKVSSTRGPSAILGQLYGVSCTAADSCTAVGISSSSSGPLAEHFSRNTWAVQAIASPAAGILYGVWCVSAGTCTAAGASGPDAQSGNNASALAEHFSGGTWHRQATASPASGQELAGVSCVLATVCTAAGFRPETFTTGSSPLAEQSH